MGSGATLPVAAPAHDHSGLSRIARWTVGLGTASAIWGVVFPFVGRLLGPLLVEPPSWLRLFLGMRSYMALEALLFVGTLWAGIVAWRKGERSALFFVAFFAGVVIGGLWVVFAAAEIIAPHP